MYINKLIKKQVMLILATVVLVGTLAVTTSFAVFEETKSNATDQKMTIGNLDVTYTGGSAISITDINPMTDSTALSKTDNIYTFTIENTGTVPYNFKVKVINNPSYTSNLLPHQYIRYSLNNGTASTLGSGQSDYELTSGVIEAGATNTYTLRLWVADASTYRLPNSVLGQEIHLKISVEGKAGSGWLPSNFKDRILALNEVKTPITEPGKEVSAYTKDDITDTSKASVSSTYQAYYITYGTGYEANGTKFNLTGTAVTSDTYANSYSSLVGKYLPNSSLSSAGSSTAGTMKTTTNLSSVYYVVSATQESFTYKEITSNKNTTEALLASTVDDYGTSYYFRGAVKNNYVEFANKCWRIVRVGGDGSVKLILHNDNPTGTANPCSSANNSTNAAFARFSGTTYKSAFNTNYNDNAYVGFMYGTAGASGYATTHANTNKSTILTNLETWYNNNLTAYESVIADTVWCNDKTNVTDTSYNPWGYIDVSGLGYGPNVTYYGATKRLVSTSDSAGGTGPSLKCNGELSKITSKVGLITADELAFAGYAYGLGNTTIYLQENATDIYWSLSPSYYGGGLADVWSVGGGGAYFFYNYVSVSNGVRPLISLKSTTNVTGEGTSSSPFIISM